jgi:hypothetical protein
VVVVVPDARVVVLAAPPPPPGRNGVTDGNVGSVNSVLIPESRLIAVDCAWARARVLMRTVVLREGIVVASYVQYRGEVVFARRSIRASLLEGEGSID